MRKKKKISNQFQIMDLILQLDLLIPQLAQLFRQMLYQEPGKETSETKLHETDALCMMLAKILDLVTAAELVSSPKAFWTLSRPVGSSTPSFRFSSLSSFRVGGGLIQVNIPGHF